jgi:ELWxxDGT repeat protein
MVWTASMCMAWALCLSSAIGAEVELVADIHPTSNSSPGVRVVAGDTLYFVASAPDVGGELWKTKGTPETTALVADLTPGGAGSPGIAQLTAVGGVVYFVFATAEAGGELWRTEGTPETTAMVADIRPGPVGSAISGMVAHLGEVWFRADDGVAGPELWRSDGTEDGTVLVGDIYSGGFGSAPAQITSIGTELWFAASQSTANSEPWWVQSGGAPLLVADIAGTSSNPEQFVGTPGLVYFVAANGAVGQEVFFSDGTPQGTDVLADVRPGTTGSVPNGLTLINGELWFSANDGVSGSEPWIVGSDGTLQVADVRPGGAGSHSSPADFVGLGDAVLFAADDGTHGKELYVSGGTPGTTTLIDIYPGASGSGAFDLIAVGDRVYGAAFGEGMGVELLVTAGTAETTEILDLRDGLAGSSPTGFVVLGGHLVFSAFIQPWGTEMYRVCTGCVVAGECYPVGAPNPENSCESCLASGDSEFSPDACGPCDIAGDLNLDGDTSVVDVQCGILVNLWSLSGAIGTPPACLAAPLGAADQDCSSAIEVTDIQLLIGQVLGTPLSPAIDADGDGCHDGCD